MKRRPFIEPTRSTATVPSALHLLRVAKQGDGDYVCARFALVTAARKLRTMSARTGGSVLLAGHDAATRARIEARLPKGGLFEKDVRALAQAAGLAVYRPHTHDVAQFHEPGWLWMVLVLVQFVPSSGGESYVDKHCGAFEVCKLSWIRAHEKMKSVHPRHRRELFDGYRYSILALHDTTFACVATAYAHELAAGPLNELAARETPRLAETPTTRSSDHDIVQRQDKSPGWQRRVSLPARAQPLRAQAPGKRRPPPPCRGTPPRRDRLATPSRWDHGT